VTTRADVAAPSHRTDDHRPGRRMIAAVRTLLATVLIRVGIDSIGDDLSFTKRFSRNGKNVTRAAPVAA